MAQDKKTRRANRIPIRFLDSERDVSSARDDEIPDGYSDGEPELTETDMAEQDNDAYVIDEAGDPAEFMAQSEVSERPTGELAGPLMAELVATRAELKRVEAENAELRDRMARRQADFENQRKRTERERADTYNRVVADIAAKLLPVLDNLKRALDAEASVEASESDEFRHFLSGVDLICKQLNGVLENLGVKPIPSVGEQFNPHVHEAVVTEPTDEYEPDTVVQEIVTGYRLGDKLIRPALVKVAVRK